jgi:DNA-binding NtrC family response regulator
MFTDYNMPGMNGIELMEQVAVRWPKIKFILASGYLDETTQSCVERCHASLISKPYIIHDAMKIILQKLANHVNNVPLLFKTAISGSCPDGVSAIHFSHCRFQNFCRTGQSA